MEPWSIFRGKNAVIISHSNKNYINRHHKLFICYGVKVVGFFVTLVSIKMNLSHCSVLQVVATNQQQYWIAICEQVDLMISDTILVVWLWLFHANFSPTCLGHSPVVNPLHIGLCASAILRSHTLSSNI